MAGSRRSQCVQRTDPAGPGAPHQLRSVGELAWSSIWFPSAKLFDDASGSRGRPIVSNTLQQASMFQVSSQPRAPFRELHRRQSTRKLSLVRAKWGYRLLGRLWSTVISWSFLIRLRHSLQIVPSSVMTCCRRAAHSGLEINRSRSSTLALRSSASLRILAVTPSIRSRRGAASNRSTAKLTANGATKHHPRRKNHNIPDHSLNRPRATK